MKERIDEMKERKGGRKNEVKRKTKEMKEGKKKSGLRDIFFTLNFSNIYH